MSKADITAEEYLKENAKPDDWSNLEECLNDSLWTNNVIKYMEEYHKEKIREVIGEIEKERNQYNKDGAARGYFDNVIEILNSKIK